MVNLLSTDGIIQFTIISGTHVETMAVFHHQNLFLTGCINTMHGYVRNRIGRDIT